MIPVRFATLLGAKTPSNWPPPVNDRHSQEYALTFFKNHPEASGWGVWYFVLLESRLTIGNGGFKGAPTADGTVELGYSILPEHKRHGCATEAVSTLVASAYSDPRVTRVIAETLPNLSPSIRVLQKAGFSQVESSEPGVIRFEHRHP